MQQSDARYQSIGRDDGGRRFRAAVRHSRRVRILRVVVPTLALLIVAAAVVMIWFNPMRLLLKLPKDVGRMVVSGTKITMEAPRLAGFTPDKRSYEMTARSAMQDLTQPDLVELKDIRAVVQMQDKGLMNMTAPNGTYDSRSETLNIPSNMLLMGDSGFEAHLATAQIDIRKGTIVSDKAVDVKMNNSTINANGIEVVDSGQLIRFTGGVVMNVAGENGRASANGGPLANGAVPAAGAVTR